MSTTFSRADAAAAYRSLMTRYGSDPRWRRSIQRGWAYMEESSRPNTTARFQWHGSVLLVRSQSDKDKRYRVTGAGCECQAAAKGDMCLHAGIWHLCNHAAELSPPF